ncbi:MAG: hypothetical protein HN726_04585, partial [Candidatus Magasanikbacteria bacterium]|nr:hypothetical protein [Candidatus Magasanikbacteria bacterium]
EALKLACEDIRAYYLEAVTAQPGHTSVEERDNWFWNETTAGKALWALKSICQASDDSMMRAMGNYVLVPRAQIEARDEDLLAADAARLEAWHRGMDNNYKRGG